MMAPAAKMPAHHQNTVVRRGSVRAGLPAVLAACAGGQLTWTPALLRVCSSRGRRKRLSLTSRRRTNARPGDSPARAGWWGRGWRRDVRAAGSGTPRPAGSGTHAPGSGVSVRAVSELWVPVVSRALLFVRHAGESH